VNDINDLPKKRLGVWLKIALAASLAVNLLFVGFVAGAAARQGGEGARMARNPGLGAFGAPYMIALQPQERRAVIRNLRASNGDIPDRSARRAMFQEVLVLLRAQPFDAQALEAAVALQAETSVAVQKNAQQAWLDIVRQMSQAERALYADAVEDVLKRGRKR